MNNGFVVKEIIKRNFVGISKFCCWLNAVFIEFLRKG